MASSLSSSGLASLYPRESDELHGLLQQHQVSAGRPEDIFSFPPTLARNQSLQKKLEAFVLQSRSRPGGPISRSAMLHLLLTGIGGPKATDLGPEADQPTALITSFLESCGDWPEDAFPDFNDAGPLSDPVAAAPSSPGRRVRSIAASLASQNSFDEIPATQGSASFQQDSGSSLQEIAGALARLAETHQKTLDQLDLIQDRLRRLESDPGAVSGMAASAPLGEGLPSESEAPPPDRIGTPASSVEAPSDAIRQHAIPLEPASQGRPAFASDPQGRDLGPVPHLDLAPETPFRKASAVPGTGADIAAAASIASAVVPLAPLVQDREEAVSSPTQGASADTNAVSTSGVSLVSDSLPSASSTAQPAAPIPSVEKTLEAASRDDMAIPAAMPSDQVQMPPTREWREIFAAPVRPKRTVAVVPLVVAILVLATIVVALVLFFRSQDNAASSPELQIGPAPAPAASVSPAAPPAGDLPLTHTPGRRQEPTVTAGATRPVAPGSDSSAPAPGRVLGARETFQPRSSGENFPAPKQPGFIAASTMDARLVYAPKPQHPRVAGLVGLSGMVVLEVIIDADGSVDDVRVLGGQHLLRDAAVNAVRTWRYRPVLENGRPVPVRTIVRIDFGRSGAVEAAR